MLNIDKQSGQPVYEQIIEEFKKLILAGSFRSGEQIPSVRALSTELSVNPNTIQKAYGELENAHITFSVPGVGRFVADDARERIGKTVSGSLQAVYEASYWLALSGAPEAGVQEEVRRAFRDAERVRGPG